MEPTLTPGSTTPAQTTSNQPAGQPAAVTQALSQAIPPNRNHVQSERESQIPSSRTAQPQQQSQDREVSLEDFGADEENPLTPKPTNRVEAKTDKPLRESTKVEKADTEKAEETEIPNEEQEVVKEEVQSEEDLKLELKLDENDLEKTTQKAKRDYSKFRPEHQEYLKKLPNHLFARAAEDFTKLYQVEQENTRLKEQVSNSVIGKLPPSYLEHPEAYTLSPKFTELSTEVNYDNFEASHWESQLARIKRGQDWMNLRGYDKNTKAPVYEKIPAIKDAEGNPQLDVDSELLVERNLQSVSELRRDHSQKLQELKAQHVVEHKRSVEALNGLKQQFFKPLLDETKLTPAIKADLQAAKDAIAKQIPAFKDSPAMELLVLSYAAMKGQGRIILKLMQQLNNNKAQQEDSVRAGPGKMAFQGGSNSGGDKILDAKDFDD